MYYSLNIKNTIIYYKYYNYYNTVLIIKYILYSINCIVF
jgi:hypothetical protein